MSAEVTTRRVAQAGTADHALALEILEGMGAVIEAVSEREDDKALVLTLAMSAVAQLAGRAFGNLLAYGIARDGDRRGAAKTVEENFRIGAKHGRDVALRAFVTRAGGRA